MVKDGNTALMWTADKDLPAIMHDLIKANANLDAIDKDGMTALHTAAFTGNEQLVHQLISAGANINVADKVRFVTYCFLVPYIHEM